MEDKYGKYMISGGVKKKTVADCLSQIRSWGLKMPDVEPLPFHFGLDDFYNTGETEFWVANMEKEGYCGKFLFVFDGQTCPYHHHKKKHETFFVVKGRVRMKVNGKDAEMGEGEVLVMPPGDKHSFTGLGPALILEVSMPCIPGDSFFEDKRIGDGRGI